MAEPEALATSPCAPPVLSLETAKYLDDIRPSIQAALEKGPGNLLKKWAPAAEVYSDPDIIAHLTSLNLWEVSESLCIGIHELGCFQQDPINRDRVASLYTKTDKFLVNGSAAGKTRLSYEGLCVNWGFLFTLVRDPPLGAQDISPHFIFGEFSTLWGVSETLSAPLVARLLVFKVFLQVACAISNATLTNDHKRSWLLIQLVPELIRMNWDDDVFRTLRRLIAQHDQTNLRHLAADAMADIYNLLPSEDRHLFIVMDQAQVAARRRQLFGPEHFIEEILKAWIPLMRPPSSPLESNFIFVGTEMPKDIGPFGTGFTWVSGTGAFDDPVRQEVYVRKFLPPKICDSNSGRHLLTRIWRWLRGRHRLTASFVQALISEGLEYPHTYLNVFFQHSSGLELQDAKDFIAKEKCSQEIRSGWKHYQLNSPMRFQKLKPEAQELFQTILYRMMTTQTPSLQLSEAYTYLVNNAVAHFVDANQSIVSVDEPIVLAAAASQSLESGWYQRPVSLEQHINLAQLPATAALHCLLFYLARTTHLAAHNFFKFVPSSRYPRWAFRDCQLVYLFRGPGTEDKLGYRSIMITGDPILDTTWPLATQTDSFEELIRWLEGRYATPFCVYSRSIGDVVFFSLRTSTGTFVRVALKVVFSAEEVTLDVWDEAYKSLQVENIIPDPEQHLARFNDALKCVPHGKLAQHKVQRVVSFLRGNDPGPDPRPTIFQSSESDSGDSAVLNALYFREPLKTPLLDSMLAGIGGSCSPKSRRDVGQPLRKQLKRKRSRSDLKY